MQISFIKSLRAINNYLNYKSINVILLKNLKIFILKLEVCKFHLT